jgi:hypothetical protein
MQNRPQIDTSEYDKCGIVADVEFLPYALSAEQINEEWLARVSHLDKG